MMFGRIRQDAPTVVATFFVGAALLGFEILTSRTMGFILGPGYVYLTLALAMLAMSCAGSVMSVASWHPTDARKATVLFGACLVSAVLIVASYYVAAWSKSVINTRIVAEGVAGGAASAFREAAATRPWAAAILAAALSGPYFLFGFILTALFQTADTRRYPSLYAANMTGGGISCLATYWSMEHGSFQLSLMLPPVCLVIGGLGYLRFWRTRTTAAVACAVIAGSVCYAVLGDAASLEPRAELHQVGKDFAYRGRPRELWHAWDSTSRITAVETAGPGSRSETWIGFGNGEAHVALLPPRQALTPSRNYLPSRLAMLLGRPARILVLFAGAGADMQALDEDLGGTADITGVEMNEKVIAGAKALPTFGVDQFLRKSNIHMVVADARTFLERATGQYDVVLLSWAGASPAYFDGSISSTTHYVFTHQAMARVFDRLKPGGYAVYLSTSKLNVVATARYLMERRGLPHPERAMVVLAPRAAAGGPSGLWWDTNALIVRPDGFSRGNVRRIQREADTVAHDVIYSPFDRMPRPDALAYDELLTRPVLAAALRDLGERSNLQLGVVTDDRPFSFDLFRDANYLSAAFWKQAWADTGQPFLQYRAQHLLFVLAVAGLGALLVFGPLLFGAALPSGREAAAHGLFFAAIGSGFMLFEVSLMQKAILLLGEPGLAFAIVLAALVTSTGIGSSISGPVAGRGVTLRQATVALVVYGIAISAGSDAWVGLVLGWGTPAKVAWLVAVMTPAGLLLGQFMPRGLACARQRDAALVPWGWAINGVSATVAAGFAQALASSFGIKAVMCGGIALYGLVLFLPTASLSVDPHQAAMEDPLADPSAREALA